MADYGSETSAVRAPVGSARPRRLRAVLLIVAGFLAALAAVAGGALLFFYDRATAIDRSTPQVVAREFLDAALVLDDSGRTSLFICARWSADEAMASAGGQREPGVIASWGAINANVVGNTATVQVRITFRYPDSRRQVEMWTLQLVDEDGWRVCGLDTDTSLEP